MFWTPTRHIDAGKVKLCLSWTHNKKIINVALRMSDVLDSLCSFSIKIVWFYVLFLYFLYKNIQKIGYI